MSRVSGGKEEIHENNLIKAVTVETTKRKAAMQARPQRDSAAGISGIETSDAESMASVCFAKLLR